MSSSPTDFSIPNRLRVYSLYDRKLLSKQSICAWKEMNAYWGSVGYDYNAVTGISIAGHLTCSPTQ